MDSTDCFDDPLNELDHLIGLVSVKQRIRRILAERKSGNPRCSAPHLLLIGRSGVGKGVVAGSIGVIFRARGLLRKGHFVYAGLSDLMAGYIGHTATKTRAKCEEAVDGVLYVDDPHRLMGGQFGGEALHVLTEFIQAHGDRLAVVMDTWPREMTGFSAAQPELLRHFEPVEFPIYSRDELVAILRTMANKARYEIPNDLGTMLLPWLEARMHRAQETGTFWRGAWNMREVLVAAARAHSARTHTTNHFKDLPSDWDRVREPVTHLGATLLDDTDLRAAMAVIER